MPPTNSFYFQCSNCAASSAQRYHVLGGALCRDCYQMFARVTAEPLASLTVERLQELKRIKKIAAAAPAQPAPSMPDASKLSAIEGLQFKKYIRENSGMTAAEVDEYLNGVADDERTELVRSFRLTLTPKPSVPAVASSVHASPITAVPASLPMSPAAISVHVLTENANQPACPKCRSTKTTFNKQGFGVGKAAIGAVLTGGLGLLAGGIGANKIKLTCLACGHSWTKG